MKLNRWCYVLTKNLANLVTHQCGGTDDGGGGMTSRGRGEGSKGLVEPWSARMLFYAFFKGSEVTKARLKIFGDLTGQHFVTVSAVDIGTKSRCHDLLP